MTRVNRIKQILDQLVCHAAEYRDFANSHMTEYFTGDLYGKLVRDELRREIESIGTDNTLEALFECKLNPCTPHLNSYVEKHKQFSLYNFHDTCLSLCSFNERLNDLGFEPVAGMSLKKFQNAKKSHEVEIMASVVATLRNVTGASHVVDVGDGKGYLSSMLTLRHDIPVLGVDSSETNTRSATDRIRKLSKRWREFSNGDDADASLYKQVTQFVTPQIDFDRLINGAFSENHDGIVLVGLHTCGNLSPTSLRIFKHDGNVTGLCNVSCCYHLLNERYEMSNACDDLVGFPMSRHLRERRVELNRNVRMLGVKSLDRILHDKELPNKYVFYRAVFEVILEMNRVKNTEHVGKLKKNLSFVEYVRVALQKIGVHIQMGDDEINGVYDKYVERETEVYVFYMLRNMLAPLIESVILLDRLLYLLENGYENSFLVHLFDPVISPRCYGLISFKNAQSVA